MSCVKLFLNTVFKTSSLVFLDVVVSPWLIAPAPIKKLEEGAYLRSKTALFERKRELVILVLFDEEKAPALAPERSAIALFFSKTVLSIV